MLFTKGFTCYHTLINPEIYPSSQESAEIPDAPRCSEASAARLQRHPGAHTGARMGHDHDWRMVNIPTIYEDDWDLR